jgi:polyribonucleotide nucleotidyltransferase
VEGPEIQSAEAVIDNGSFGTRKVRFETGRLARQAAGSAVAYLDDETMILSATSVSRQPKEQFDFFPLTVDVEERMYAAGRIPGSFFRREGRPSEDAILTDRLIDRPLRPSFAKGLRNEIQIVETVLALAPEHLYDVVAINAASMSTQIAGLPFTGPIGAVRVALIDSQWVAFPTHSELERAAFDMVVAGRVLEDGDVAIMMVEAEATPATVSLVAAGSTAPTEEVVAEGLEAAKPFIKALSPTSPRARRSRSPSSPSTSITRTTCSRRCPPPSATSLRKPSRSGLSRTVRPSLTGSRLSQSRRSDRSSRAGRKRSVVPSAL